MRWLDRLTLCLSVGFFTQVSYGDGDPLLPPEFAPEL